MRFISLFTCVVLCTLGSSVYSNQFEEFAIKNKKNYKDSTEKIKRARIYTQNAKKIDALNLNAKKQNRNLKFAVNKFADMDTQEFIKAYTGFKKSPEERTFLDNQPKQKTTKIPKTKTTKTSRTKKTTTPKTTTTTTPRTTFAASGDFFGKELNLF